MSEDKAFTPADEDLELPEADAPFPSDAYSMALSFLSSTEDLLESVPGMTKEKMIAYSFQAAQVYGLLAIAEVLGEQTA